MKVARRPTPRAPAWADDNVADIEILPDSEMVDWVAEFIESAGYLGIALLMFAENIFPPIPSELVMPLGGFAAARGELQLALVVVAGGAGSLLGALFWYYVGKWLGSERLKRWAHRHGRWLTTAPEDIDRACAWFGRHGGKAVLFGRMIPTIRTLISVPAGIALMPLRPFLLYSALGTALWTAALAVTGFVLEDQYDAVSHVMNPLSTAVIVILVAAYAYRVVTFRQRPRSR